MWLQMKGGDKNSNKFEGLPHFGIKSSKFDEQKGYGLFAGLVYEEVECWNAPTTVSVTKTKKRKKKGKKKARNFDPRFGQDE